MYVTFRITLPSPVFALMIACTWHELHEFFVKHDDTDIPEWSDNVPTRFLFFCFFFTTSNTVNVQWGWRQVTVKKSPRKGIIGLWCCFEVYLRSLCCCTMNPQRRKPENVECLWRMECYLSFVSLFCRQWSKTSSTSSDQYSGCNRCNHSEMYYRKLLQFVTIWSVKHDCDMLCK